MKTERKIVLGVLVLSIFLFIVAVSSLYVQMQIESGNICGCVIPLYLFIPFLASLGLFIGTLIYHMLSPERGKPDLRPVLKFLDEEHRRVIEFVIDNGGEVKQADIVRVTGIPKVRVFRILQSLASKGILTKERDRKTNIIRLNEDLRKVFYH